MLICSYSKTKKESYVTMKCKRVPQNLFEFPPSLNILIYNDSTVLEHYFITYIQLLMNIQYDL